MCEPSTVLVDVADLEVCGDEDLNMDEFLMTHSAAGPTTLKPGTIQKKPLSIISEIKLN
jgi:hypothetical protein